VFETRVLKRTFGPKEGKRPLGKPRRSWMDNIKMGLRIIGWGGINWIDVDQGRE
jgi:hypothetical protein